MRWAPRVGLLAAGLLSGCFATVAERCPTCSELAVGRRPEVPPGTRTVFLLVPGILGYGWEWNGAQVALARYPDAALLVYSWRPWDSLTVASERLAEHIGYLTRRLPPSVRELVVLSHSAAGLLTVEAAGRVTADAVRPPNRPAGAPLTIRMVAIGAPLAGMGRNPWGSQDMLHTPLALALGSRFTRWPEPAPGITLELYTTGPDDPVMRPMFGHDPGDPRVLPRRARLHRLPGNVGHNVALTWICEHLLDDALAQVKAESEAQAAYVRTNATPPRVVRD